MSPWWLLLGALFCAVIALPVLLFRPPALFVVRITGGSARARRGIVTGAFLAAVDEVAGRCGVVRGEIRGVRRGRGISLWFSRGLPAGFQQLVRNWWGIHGWACRPGGGDNPPPPNQTRVRGS